MSGTPGLRSFVLVASLISLWGLTASAQDRPHAYYLLIDTSASMTETPRAPKVPEDWKESKLEVVKRQLGDFCAALPAETEVVIYTFDSDVREGPQVVILGNDQRQQLRAFFGEFAAKGKQTHLWRSLAFVLEKVSQSVEATPGKMARVLIYTDGEDNDPTAPDPAAILERHKELIKDRGRVTYVTLGFTLRSDYQQVLATYGVRMQASLSPAEIIPLEASFSWHPRQPVVGEEVQLVDHSGGVIREYSWDFGDGTAKSGLKAPVHVYQKPGQYAVVLEIRSPSEETDSVTYQVTVVDKVPLKAQFKKPPEEVPAGTPVYFVNESQGSVDAFAWDFGDGQTSTEQHPVHPFAKPGVYTVRLTVTDAKGNKDEYALEEAVRVKPPEPPKADFIAPSAAVEVGQPAQFFDRSQGLIEELTWDFGDESPTSSERDPVHRYAKPGTYTVTLTARGPGGSTPKSSPVEIVPPEPPKADFTSPASVPVGESIQFFDRSRGSMEGFSWDFGDGSDPSTERDPIHQYAEPKKYEVTLTVSGPGGSDATSKSVEVMPHAAPEADFVIGTTQATIKEEIVFTDQSKGVVTSAHWDFGDDSQPVDVNYATEGAEKSVKHAFTNAGKYTVTLVVQGPSGKDEAQKPVEVGSGWIPPEAQFSVDRRKGRESLDVHFTNETTGTVARYVWDFDDGSSPVVQQSLSDVDHTYGPGTYSPTLTAEGPEKFAVSKYTLEDPIVVKPPKGWWGKHWWKVVLIVAAAAVIAWFGWKAWKRYRELVGLRVLTGSISCKPVVPADAAWRPFVVSGEGATYVFSPAESLPPDAPAADRDRDLTATLTKSVDPTSFEESYELALHRGDTSEGTVTVEPGQDVQQSGYLFRYQA